MSKVMQEHYLVIYQQFEDLFEKVEHLKSRAFEGKYLYKTKDRKLIVKTEYGEQQCYYFMMFDGKVEKFWESIAGAQFVHPIFLNGEYPNTLIMYILSRCRGGSWKVDEI